MTDDGRPALFQRDWPTRDDTAPAFLVVHGLSEHSGRYDRFAARALEAGFAVAAVDLYGHGRSPGARGHIRGFDLDHLGAVDEMIRRVERDGPQRPLFLLGHSLGGLIAARWAQRRVFADRLRGLALLAPFVAPRVRVPAWKRLAATTIGRLVPAFSLPTGIPDEAVFREPAEQTAFAADPLVQRRMSAGHWLALNEQRACLVAEAGTLRTPTLVLVAGDDRVVDTGASRAFAERLPEATVRAYPEAFHALHHDPATPRVLDDLFAWARSRLRA